MPINMSMSPATKLYKVLEQVVLEYREYDRLFGTTLEKVDKVMEEYRDWIASSVPDNLN